MRKLDLSKCITNEDVCQLVSDRINEIRFEELLEIVNKKFVNQEKAVKAIYTGLSMNMNVFLSGPGGYGKSTLIKFILDFYKIPYHTIIGYKDMPVDALLGIPNMDKLLKKSEYELNFKKSVFYKPGILIGEEFTDILPSTAAALKDILTEKGFRNKDGKVESLIACMIIAANKSSTEIADDPSKKAFYEERFPIRVEVVWEEHTVDFYFNLFIKTFPKTNEELLYFMAKLFEENHLEHNNTVSPRTAINITKVFITKGIEFISHFDINIEKITEIKLKADLEYKRRFFIKNFNEIFTFIEGLKYPDNLISLLYLENKLNTFKFDNTIITEFSKIKTKISEKLNTIYRGHSIKAINTIDTFINNIKND